MRVLTKRRACLLAASVATLLAVVSVVVASVMSSGLVLTKYFIEVSTLANEIRIAHLSDLHLSSFGTKEEKVIEFVAEARPDIVVMTGDLVGSRSRVKALAKFMSRLRERLGSDVPVYAVLGNWEYQLGIREGVKEVLRTFRANLLVNSYAVVEVKGSRVVIAGLDDATLGSPNLSVITELSKLPSNYVKVLLIHEPALGIEAIKRGFNGVVLAGHCHGGQVKILGNPIFLPSGCSRKYYEGMHRIKNSYLVISRGVGYAIVPIRIGVNPEVVLITLKPSTGSVR